MSGPAVNHHFLPQAYLRAFSSDGRSVNAYSLLVPDERWPLWRQVGLRSAASRERLYTFMRGGREVDTFERWLNDDVENPAAEALRRVVADQPLSKPQWDRLATYLGALDLRTPASYLWFMELAEKHAPEALNRTMDGLRQRLEEAARTGVPLAAPPVVESDGPEVPITVRIREAEPGRDEVPVETSIFLGRDLWLYHVRSALLRGQHFLHAHKWIVARPHPGCAWFTSDRPVMRLQYNSPDDFDFEGGWNSPGTEIMLPLSPQHMMFTRVGGDVPDELTFDIDKTFLLQRLLAQRAHRQVFALGEPRRPILFRPRRVDRAMFEAEEASWARWHEEHSRQSADAAGLPVLEQAVVDRPPVPREDGPSAE